MQFIISSRKLDVTPDVKEYVEEKIGRMKKYFGNIIFARVELEREEKRDDGKDFTCEVLLSVPGQKIRVDRQRGTELFEAIDLAEKALESQIKTLKDKYEDENWPSKEEMRELEKQAAEPKVSADDYEYAYEFEGEPMTLEEAKQQMELLGNDFYVFTNKDTGRTNTVYKKSNGRYGVIIER